MCAATDNGRSLSVAISMATPGRGGMAGFMFVSGALIDSRSFRLASESSGGFSVLRGGGGAALRTPLLTAAAPSLLLR